MKKEWKCCKLWT